MEASEAVAPSFWVCMDERSFLGHHAVRREAFFA